MAKEGNLEGVIKNVKKLPKRMEKTFDTCHKNMTK